MNFLNGAAALFYVAPNQRKMRLLFVVTQLF